MLPSSNVASTSQLPLGPVHEERSRPDGSGRAMRPRARGRGRTRRARAPRLLDGPQQVSLRHDHTAARPRPDRALREVRHCAVRAPGGCLAGERRSLGALVGGDLDPAALGFVEPADVGIRARIPAGALACHAPGGGGEDEAAFVPPGCFPLGRAGKLDRLQRALLVGEVEGAARLFRGGGSSGSEVVEAVGGSGLASVAGSGADSPRSASNPAATAIAATTTTTAAVRPRRT